VLRHGSLQPLPQAQGRLGQTVLAPLARARSPFFSGVGGGERKTFGLGVGLLRGASSPPRSPRASSTSPSSPALVAAVLKKMPFGLSLLSFCTSFSQLSRCGLATPSLSDGSCAGTTICRQPVLRTLCLTNLWHRQLSSVFIHLTDSPFGLHVYHLH
jgi:hypothetical protein